MTAFTWIWVALNAIDEASTQALTRMGWADELNPVYGGVHPLLAFDHQSKRDHPDSPPAGMPESGASGGGQNHRRRSLRLGWGDRGKYAVVGWSDYRIRRQAAVSQADIEMSRRIPPAPLMMGLGEHTEIIIGPRPHVGLRQRFRRKMDALAYRLLYLLCAPQALPEARAWQDGYHCGWQDASRYHLEQVIGMMSRPPANHSEKGFEK